MLWAAVPETSIDVDSDLRPGEHQVGASATRNGGYIDAVTEAEAPHRPTKC